MFKFSDTKADDILITNNVNGNEFKVLEAERQGDAYYFYIENLQSKARSRFRVQEGDETKFGLAKIVHA